MPSRFLKKPVGGFKEGETVNLTVPNHKELGTGILRKLIRFSGMTVEEFKALL